MPELPEVETVARQLSAVLKGKKIQHFEVLDRKLDALRRFNLSAFHVVDVYRLGKQLVLELEQKRPFARRYLAVHLRMSGRMIWAPQSGARREPASKEREKHVRALFRLKGGVLKFIDPRRFGTILFCESLEEIRPSGVDPIIDNFGSKQLSELIGSSRQPIKNWLLRQDRLVGIGNIYACEILFAARIHPLRQAADLTPDDHKRICSSYEKNPKARDR